MDRAITLFCLLKKGKEYDKMNNVSGHGAAVARAVRDREVAGSNPVAPTIAVKSRVLTILLNILSIWIGIITH